MNRKIISFAAALTLAASVFTAMAFAQQGRPGGRGGEGFGPPPGRDGGVPFARDLNLTDDQKAQIKKIQETFAANTKTLHEQLGQLRDDPAADGTFDEAAVRAKAQQRAAIQVELEVARARQMAQVFAILMPEQKAKLAERRQQMEQRRREMPPPPPPGEDAPGGN